MMKFTTCSVEETERRAAGLAAKVKFGTVILLKGDLGAGKTAFTRGFARALGVTEPVSSPTFTIVQEYPLPGGKMLYHMDLYRISGADSALAFGIDEFLDNPSAVSLIEWPDQAAGIYPPDAVTIEITRDPDDENRRFFQITGI